MPRRTTRCDARISNAAPKNAMSDEWMVKLPRRAAIGHVATRWDYQPFITPTSFWYDEAQHAIVFHSNIVGRIRANSERHDQVRLRGQQIRRVPLPTWRWNPPCSMKSVIVFGKIWVIEEAEEKRRALYGLIRVLPNADGRQGDRPITDQELKRTSVYAIAIDSWSGKRKPAG